MFVAVKDRFRIDTKAPIDKLFIPITLFELDSTSIKDVFDRFDLYFLKNSIIGADKIKK
jgi:hypothetical protein